MKSKFKLILSLGMSALILASCGGNHSSPTNPNSIEETESITRSSFNYNTIKEVDLSTLPQDQIYKSLGVGGGGAMSGFSMSPYSSLWFVGTDMGTLFRSVDKGVTWTAINQSQAVFSSDLKNAVGVGFSSNPLIVFHAPAGLQPKRSVDAGKTWTAILPAKFPLAIDERIKYWRGIASIANTCWRELIKVYG